MNKICIIGAGASGLTTLKHVLENPNADVVVLERAGSTGGVWRYCEKKGTPETKERFPTPMYQDLHMNTPHLMGRFLEFPWPEDTPCFPTRQNAFDYLESYANTFNLMRHIKFNQEVVNVKPIDPNNRENPRWNVEVKDLESGKASTHEFDVIIVCTGREMVPYVSVIPNIENFKGIVTHPDKYTSPEVYSGKRVLLLGAGPSTIDISVALIPFAKEIIVSCKPVPKMFNVEQKFPPPIRTVVPWKSATSNGFILQDGTELNGIDVVIVATGYDYNHSFLAPECGISLEHGRRVNFLYQHIINVKFPTMCFVGIIFYGPGYSMFSVQSKWLAKVLDGTVKLPSESEMMEHIKNYRAEIVSLGLNEFNFAHNIAIQQWEMFDELSKEGGFTLSPHAKQIFDNLLPRLFTDPANFRKDIYRIIDENKVHIEVVSDSN